MDQSSQSSTDSDNVRLSELQLNLAMYQTEQENNMVANVDVSDRHTEHNVEKESVNTMSDVIGLGEKGMLNQIQLMFASFASEFKKDNAKFKEELSASLDTKLSEKLSSVDTKISSLKTDMELMKEELTNLLNNTVANLDVKITAVSEELTVTKTQVNGRLTDVEINVELIKDGLVKVNQTTKTELLHHKQQVSCKLNEVKEQVSECFTKINHNVVELDMFKARVNRDLERFRNLVDNELRGYVNNEEQMILGRPRPNNASSDVQVTKEKLISVDKSSHNGDLPFREGGSKSEQNVVDINRSNMSSNNKEVEISLELLLINFEGDVHPMFFLQFVKKYIQLSTNHWQQQQMVILKHMKGDSEKWFRNYFMNWDNFQQFEIAFKNKYWGKLEQHRFICDLMGRGNFQKGKSDLVSYVMDYYVKSTYLDNPIDMSTFISYISNHLPENIGTALLVAENVTCKEGLEACLKNLSNVCNSGRPSFVNFRDNNERGEGDDPRNSKPRWNNNNYNDNANQNWSSHKNYRNRDSKDREIGVRHSSIRYDKHRGNDTYRSYDNTKRYSECKTDDSRPSDRKSYEGLNRKY